MFMIAFYSLVGGAGKTTLAATLARYAAVEGLGRSTLLWDIDRLATASNLFGADSAAMRDGSSILSPAMGTSSSVRPTDVSNLSILPMDRPLAEIHESFEQSNVRKAPLKLSSQISETYDLVIVDCPIGLMASVDQALRDAKLIIVPVLTSPLSFYILECTIRHLRDKHDRIAPVLPVFNMVNRKRELHLSALAGQPEWPVIPIARSLEAMPPEIAGAGVYDGGGQLGQAVAALWREIERRTTG